MHLPEKHSLLYLSMLLQQELFTQNKTEEMGEGEKNLKFSCRLETCWLKFNPGRGQGRMWAIDLWKSRVEGERWPHRYNTPFILWGIPNLEIPCHLFQETQPPLCRPQDNPLRSMGAWYRWDTWMEPRKTDIALSLELELHLVIFTCRRFKLRL